MSLAAGSKTDPHGSADSSGVLSLGGAHALLRRPLVHDAAGVAPAVTLTLLPGASCCVRIVATGRWPSGERADPSSAPMLPALASAEWVIQNVGGGGPEALVALLVRSSSTVGSQSSGLRWDSFARVHSDSGGGSKRAAAAAAAGALSVTLELHASAGPGAQAGPTHIVGAFSVITIEGEFEL